MENQIINKERAAKFAADLKESNIKEENILLTKIIICSFALVPIIYIVLEISKLFN